MFGLEFITHHENRQAEKEEAAADKEYGKKKRGGVQVPAEWPWEEAKKVFEQPDVTPSDQIEVGSSRICLLFKPVTNLSPQLEWAAPDVEGLVDFLVKEKGFK